jgi:phosphotriesterase-related protein
MLGGYFLSPQTNPPTPWPAEKFANLFTKEVTEFTKEVTEGMVVPRMNAAAPPGWLSPPLTATA